MSRKLRNLLCVFISAVLTTVTLAGCALFKDDLVYEYGLAVAKLDNITITKKQLIDGFNSYGYNFVSNQGMELDEAYDETLTAILDREIMYLESLRLFGAPTEEEIKTARKKAYDNMASSYKSVEKEVRERKNMADTTADEKKEDDNKVVYTPYEKYINYTTDGRYELDLKKYDKTNTDSIDTFENADGKHSEFIAYLETPRGDNSIERQITSEAFSKLLRYLTNNEKGVATTWNAEKNKWVYKNVVYEDKNLAKDRELKLDALRRELDRMIFETEKQEVINRLETAFNLGLSSPYVNEEVTIGEDGETIMPPTNKTWGDTVTREYMTIKNGRLVKDTYTKTYYEIMLDMQKNDFYKFSQEIQRNNSVYVNDVATRARASFRDNVYNARYRYDNGFEAGSGFAEKILSSFKDLYFVPNDKSTDFLASKFFTVSHILLQYTDEQKEEFEAIKSRYAQDQNRENYDRDLAILRSQVTTQKTIDGEKTGDPMNAQTVLEYVKSQIGENMPMYGEGSKTEKFRDMIYMFNSDPGMQNPEFEYVIGADIREEKDRGINSTAEDTMSKMVKEFTRASRDLFNYNENEHRGGFKRTEDGRLVSTLGSISDLVWTDYGAHIIMYTRNVTDILFTGNLDEVDDAVDQYLHKTFTSYGNKTYFDAMVETITKPAYNDYETNLVQDYKIGKTINLYKEHYKNLTKTKK